MKTLVLKCDEVVYNEDLRKMNELQFKVTANTLEDLNYITVFSLLSSSQNPKWEIIKGNGYFSNAMGTTNDGLFCEGKTIYVVAITDLIISIQNFDIVTSNLGDDDSIFCVLRQEGGSICTVETKEIKNKTFLEDLNLGFHCGLIGDVIDLKGLTKNKRIHCSSLYSYLNGNVSQLSDNIEILQLTYKNSNVIPKGNFSWSMEQIASKPKLNRIFVDSHPSTGGDIYNMLIKKTGDFYLSASRSNLNPLSTNVVVTCSYISGVSAIPNVNIEHLGLYKTGSMDKQNTLAFMTMLKDGIDSGQMQVISEAENIAINVLQTIIKDEDIVALKTTLANEPYNITVNMFT